jgi:hydroxymethylbilane synthase
VKRTIIVGTRASALALVQTEQIVAALQALHPGRDFTIRHITTHGDRVLDRSLTAIGGKGVFVKEIEDALLAGTIDLAVHSLKDLPTEQPAGLLVAAVPERADPRDVLATRDGARLAELSQGARLGTSSLRRSVQLRALRPDLQIADIRGNVDTRLRKLDEGQYDGIVLAAAGLSRLGLGQRAVELFDPQVFVPAPAQGALALELRADDAELCSLLAPLDHAPTHAAVTAERAFLCGLGGGCDMPIGAYARQLQDGRLALRAMRADPDGRNLRYGEAQGALSEAEALGNKLAAELLNDHVEMHDDR